MPTVITGTTGAGVIGITTIGEAITHITAITTPLILMVTTTHLTTITHPTRGSKDLTAAVTHRSAWPGIAGGEVEGGGRWEWPPSFC